MREKALHIEATEKSYARAEGEAAGLKKGEAIGIKKGEAIGIEKGKSELLSELIKQGVITEEQAKDYRN